jgi:hypothetical protein
MNAKADLHVHSKHSNRPSEWVLRQFEAPESFTEPLEIYRRARARGMDFVTVSDHDSVAGALEIAHLPGTFLSSEVTAVFPHDGCEVHCLVLGVSEAQHAEIQRLRGNLYELRDYLRREDVVCSIAHPFFRVNNRLTLDHVEQLIVLFPRFEALNGIHDRLLNELARKILGNLTREAVEDLAERHRLEPWGPRPWVKSFTGGSDDHGGIYIATAFTETPAATTVEGFLAHLRCGASEAAGETGSTLRLTQSLYAIAQEWYRRRFGPLLGNRRDPFSRLLRELAGEPTPKRSFSFLPARRRTADEAPGPELDRAAFRFTSRASRKALDDLLTGTVRHLRRGRLAEALGELSRLAPLALTAAPFLVALQSQHKDQALLETAAARFLPPAERPVLQDRRAWFTDTLGDVNGVATTVRALVRTAARRGLDLTAVTCGPRRPPEELPVHNFTPIATFDLPGYESVRLSLPPLLDVLEHCERERYSEILVSTPGPLGLAGLAAAKLLGLRLTGFYHTDFPAYVQSYSGSDALTATAWAFLRWFYGQMDTVYVASRASLEQLAAHGFDRSRLQILPRGVDGEPLLDELWERRTARPADTETALRLVPEAMEEPELALCTA